MRAVEPASFEYSDPPFPGMAWMYADQSTYGGEVDHPALVSRLEADYDAGRLCGFALSTSGKTLKKVLKMFRHDWPTLRVCPWVKPQNVAARARGPVHRWEPLIVVGGRRVPPGLQDWLDEPEAIRTAVARGGGSSLIGRKSQKWCAWLFDVLGMVPGDTLIDTFPGSGIVTRAWAELSSAAAARPSPVAGARRLLGPLASPDDRGVAHG